MLRVIIAGGRDFDDSGLLYRTMDRLLRNRWRREVTIVHGDARGADRLGAMYAGEMGYACEAHPADWKRHGRAAGVIRNREMAELANALVAFWDGRSRGTKHMIECARELGLSVRVVRYDRVAPQDAP